MNDTIDITNVTSVDLVLTDGTWVATFEGTVEGMSILNNKLYIAIAGSPDLRAYIANPQVEDPRFPATPPDPPPGPMDAS